MACLINKSILNDREDIEFAAGEGFICGGKEVSGQAVQGSTLAN